MASTTLGWACPKINGPQEQQKSVYLFPSASKTKAPSPLSINNGVPPTEPKARTGELTPPGKYFFACSNNFSDCSFFISKIIFCELTNSFRSAATNILYRETNTILSLPPMNKANHSFSWKVGWKSNYFK